MTHDCGFLDDLDLDGGVSFGDATRDGHAGDFGTVERDEVRPDAVVYAASTGDVSAVLGAAADRGVPVTPYAAGTGLEGAATPVEGGVSLDLTRMDEVVEVRPGDFQVDVAAGVLGADVDDAVGEYGLFFPPLPSSGDISTIGGMIATDASGMQTVKYGEVRDWLLEVEAVLADGRVVTAGSRAAKTSSGYNLRDLLVGSEGTLGVVTEATLELAGIPEQTRAGRAVFASLDDATAAVLDAVQSGVDVAKIELLDADSAAMANAYTGTDLPDRPTVFLEFHADHGVDDEVGFCRSVFDAHDPEQFEVAADDGGMDDLWRARRELTYAIRTWDADREPVHPGDVTVPISEYPDLIGYAKDLGADASLTVPCFGHAGDGNVHYTVLADPDDDAEWERAEALYRQVVERAIAVGGTATGEHGVGLGKREFLEPEHGDAAVDAMRAVKRALDPDGVLNPGKLFPETTADGRANADRADGG